jgi:hypothetical protein
MAAKCQDGRWLKPRVKASKMDTYSHKFLASEAWSKRPLALRAWSWKTLGLQVQPAGFGQRPEIASAGRASPCLPDFYLGRAKGPQPPDGNSSEFLLPNMSSLSARIHRPLIHNRIQIQNFRSSFSFEWAVLCNLHSHYNKWEIEISL